MAKNTIRHSFNGTVIKKFVECIEKISASSSIILSSNIQKHFGPNGKTVYLKGQFLFIDSSVLEIAIFVTELHNKLSIPSAERCGRGHDVLSTTSAIDRGLICVQL